MNSREFGTFGEDVAARFLEKNGYTIVCRNYRCKCGEIDIVAERDNKLVFMEVKTRSSFEYGRPCESVSVEKRRHVKQAAYRYLKEIADMSYEPTGFRCDVMEITVNHIKNAF